MRRRKRESSQIPFPNIPSVTTQSWDSGSCEGDGKMSSLAGKPCAQGKEQTLKDNRKTQ